MDASETNQAERICERCGELLNPATAVALELDQDTALFHEPGKLPAGHASQGLFDFGAACARAVLKAGGHNNRITRPSRSTRWPRRSAEGR